MTTFAAPVFLLALVVGAPTAFAGEANVLEVNADCEVHRICHFEVTVRHTDSGWQHYADRWEILDEDGNVLATRVLRHPHVDEQPFTRSLIGVVLPVGLERVRVRAHDSVHEFGGAEILVELQRGD